MQEGTRTTAAILREVCEGTDVTPADVMGRSRFPRIVEVRYRALRAISAELGYGPTRAARCLGGRDHTIGIRALRRPDRPLDAMPALRRPKVKPIIVRVRIAGLPAFFALT